MAALPYMQLYVADYLSDAAHLTAIQHGAYLLLLFNYWQKGHPLNNSNERLANVARMSNEEWLENKSIIAEFFEIDGDEWRHSRVDADLSAVAAKSTKAKAAGKASANNRAAKVEQTPSERSTNAEQSFNHTDTDTDTDKRTPVVPKGDEVALVSAYHDLLPNCQRTEVLNPKRKKRIGAVVKLARGVCAEQGWPYEPIGFWHAYFAECAKDPWMRGEVPNPKSSTWKQNLDVLIAEDRFAQVMDRAIESLRRSA